MNVDEAIGIIESCFSMIELRDALQKIIEEFGFSSFNFLDVGQPHADIPYYIGTTGERWENEYKSNGFIRVDHCVQHARRTNLPFSWDAIALKPYDTGRKPGNHKLMEAANDYGFKNGLVIPFHFTDQLGRTHSSLCVFYWKNSLKRFSFLLREKKHDLHIILIYWVQHAVGIVATQERKQIGLFETVCVSDSKIKLTDRERDVLSWAARGKTTTDTADILGIGSETVSTHLRHAMNKLNATNKTHAAVRAVYLGLIDV